MNFALYLDYEFAPNTVLGAPLSSILFEDNGTVEVCNYDITIILVGRLGCFIPLNVCIEFNQSHNICQSF